MSILSVDNISPIGSGTSVTINNAATLVLNNVSVAGVVTATGYVTTGVGDITIGGELNLTSNGNKNRFIDSSLNDGEGLHLRSTQGGDTNHENMAQFHRNGSVKLFYDNVEKFATSNTGATLTGNLAVSAGNGIDFSAQTAASSGSVVSEVMNHFSTGTIGLTLKAGSNTVPLYNNTARYTRIGNICFISAWIRVHGGNVGSSYSSSDTLKLTGLPFAGSGNSDGRTRMRFNGYAFTGVSNRTWGWLVVSDGATSTEHELHWGDLAFSGLQAPNGTHIHNSSAEIYINGHYFI